MSAGDEASTAAHVRKVCRTPAVGWDRHAGPPPRRARRPPEPRPARRRGARRRPVAGGRRGRFGQDAGAHPPHRPPHLRARCQPLRHPRHHLHQQGRRRDAPAGRGPGGPGGPQDVGEHVPLRVRAHPAARRRPARLPLQLQHLRPGRRPAAHRLRHPRPGPRPQEVHVQGRPRRGERGQERPRLTGSVHRAGDEHLRATHRRHLPGVPGPAGEGRRHGLRRPAHRHRPPLPHLPGRARALPAALRAHPGRRVPGHQPGPERAGAAARGRAPQRHRRRGQRPVDLCLSRRRHVEHPRVRAGLPRRHHDPAGAELPVDADDPRRRQRGDREQPEPQAQEPLDRPGARRQDHPLPRRRRGRRVAVGGPHRRQPPRQRRPPLGRRGGLLPHQRPEPRRGGGVHALGHPLQGGRGHAVLRPPGDQGRAGLREGGGEPGRRGERQAGAERPQAGRRRHHGRDASTRGPTPTASPSAKRSATPRRPG